MVVDTLAPSQTVRQIIRMPKKRRKYNPYVSQIHKFKRTYNYGTFSSDGINPTLISFNFSMHDMPGYSELTSLFDFYKLTGVHVRIIPWTQTDSNSQATLNNARNSPFFYAIDRNDSSAPASVDEVLENNDHRISSTYSGANVWIPYPKFSDATGASRDGWVATTNASLNWFGLKVAIPATATANFATIKKKRNDNDKAQVFDKPLLRDIEWIVFRDVTVARGFSGFELDEQYSCYHGLVQEDRKSVV